MEIGAVYRFDGSHPEWENIAGPCALDRERDAYVPYRYTIANTTRGFSANPESKFQTSASAQIGDVLLMGDDRGGGRCADTYNSFEAENRQALTIWADFDPGETKDYDGAIILTGFFTPNAPDGRFTEFAGQIEWASFLNAGSPGDATGVLDVLPSASP